MRVILLAVKFVFLAIIYLFILRVFYVIISDLRRSSAGPQPSRTGHMPSSGAELVVTASKDPSAKEGEIIRLGVETRIGRGPHNHVKLTDNFVSHDHAQIIFKQGNYFLEDLGSVNGTYINGVRLTGLTPLTHGDTIRIAGATFKFVRWEYEVE